MTPQTSASVLDGNGHRPTMTALVKTHPGVGHVDLVEVPEPECPAGRVKVEVAFTGLCGTDIHVFHDRFRNYPPVILGHEFSGTVVETGAGITRRKIGDRVTVLGASTVVCGECEYCRQGYFMFCDVRRGMGHGVSGSLTRYIVARPDQLYSLPDSVSLEEGALSEPFAAAVQAIEELTTFSVGDTVLLSGPGPIGLLCLVLLLSHKCKVIVSGTGDDRLRLERAAEIGADRVVDISREDLQSVIDRETHGRGVDAVVEASGSAGGVRACLQAVRKLGRYVQVGIAGDDITIPFDQVLYKQLSVYGSLGYSLKTWDRLVRILEQRKLDLSPLITHKLPLTKWREAFDLCESKQGTKVLLYYNDARI